MTAAAMRRDPGNALVALAGLARSLPSAALIAVEALGLLAALAIYLWAPRKLYFALPFVALVAFALWGVADHFAAARYGHQYKVQRRMLRTFQTIVAFSGTIALLLGIFALVGWAMGVYIS